MASMQQQKLVKTTFWYVNALANHASPPLAHQIKNSVQASYAEQLCEQPFMGAILLINSNTLTHHQRGCVLEKKNIPVALVSATAAVVVAAKSMPASMDDKLSALKPLFARSVCITLYAVSLLGIFSVFINLFLLGVFFHLHMWPRKSL